MVSGRTGEFLYDFDHGEVGHGRGDLDGDGHADLLLTSNTWLTEDDPVDAAWNLGRMEVISGRTGAVLLTITGEQIRARHK